MTALTALLIGGTPVDQSGENGLTPLMSAVLANQVACMNTLLTFYADLSRTDRFFVSTN